MKKNRIKTSTAAWGVAVAVLAVATGSVVVLDRAGGARGTPLFTADQRGRRLYERERFVEAADAFADPVWKGVALYRANEFERAAGVFAGIDTAEGAYNHGNALVLLGKYDEAISRYDRALELRSGWEDARVNRSIAVARAERLRVEGAEMTGGMIGADEIRVGETGPSDSTGGEETVDGGESLSDAELRSLWLRRVQTRSGDFLKAKFAYQHARRQK